VAQEIANRIHHVAILVRSIDDSLAYYRDQLQLSVVSDDDLPQVGARLVMLDAGSVLLQLVQPTGENYLNEDLKRKGEGLHHLCFAVPEMESAIARFAPGQSLPIMGGGDRLRTAFLPAEPNNVRTELIEIGPTVYEEGAR
jgi:methylmalonyl-CoA/ethylmalonyl-CoA epimerase